MAGKAKPDLAFDARLVKEARDMERMSQPAFADLLGVGVQTLRNWECGRRRVPAWVWKFHGLYRKAKRLQQTVDRLK